jgi:hypothetical protein
LDELFAALDNELRRRLLVFMGEYGPVSFTTLLKYSGVETSKLSFHLGKMKPLFTQDEKKRYMLNEEGLRALDVVMYLEGVGGLDNEVKSIEVGFMDKLRVLGLALFGFGMLAVFGQVIYVMLEDVNVPRGIRFGVTSIILGLIIILVSITRERLKEVKEENDFSEY